MSFFAIKLKEFDVWLGKKYLVYGRDMTESIIITKESVWMGYGWRFEEFINVLDEKIGVKND